MPPEPHGPSVPRAWLARARGNLARAKQPKPKDAYWEDFCFDAQQAVEKAIKAVLVLRGIAFPKTHDIRDLLTLLDPAKRDLPDSIWKAIDLTDYAVESRYPEGAEPVSEEDHREAVEIAEVVVRWAERQIAAGK